MASDVAGVTTLCNSAIGVLSTVCVNRIRAVVLLIVLALIAGQVGANLSANTGTVANLDLGDLGSDLDDLTNDLVSYAERKGN